MIIATGLRGRPNPDSQANGALTRVSPLGIFGAGSQCDSSKAADWVRQDAAITHPNPVCQVANALYTMAIAHAIRTGCDAQTLYAAIADWTGPECFWPVDALVLADSHRREKLLLKYLAGMNGWEILSHVYISMIVYDRN